jgi:hypothetical protein
MPKLVTTPSGMTRLDRLIWEAGISFMAYGRRVGIRVNDPEVLTRLPRHLPFGWESTNEPAVERLYSLRVATNAANSKPRRAHLLYCGADRLAYSKNLDDIFEVLESDLQYYVAEWSRYKVFVHAGVVGWRGRAIVIPGRSNAGKSTLVHELVRAGATYYSDEYAVLDSRGRVHPYARPISLRENGDAGKQTKHAVESFEGRAGTNPLPVGLIVATRYRTGARWSARLLTPGEAAMELLANTVAVRRQPQKTLATLRAAVGSASALKGVRGEARNAAQPLLAIADPGNSSLGMAELLKEQGRVIRRLDSARQGLMVEEDIDSSDRLLEMAG